MRTSISTQRCAPLAKETRQPAEGTPFPTPRAPMQASAHRLLLLPHSADLDQLIACCRVSHISLRAVVRSQVFTFDICQRISASPEP